MERNKRWWKTGEGEPDGKAERNGGTQPDFGQAGTAGKAPGPDT